MRWLLYNALFAIAYTAMLPKFLLRMRKRGGYKAHFAERFGRYDEQTARRIAEKPRVWVHAVSVGEANLVGTILRELRRRDASESFVISTTSSTGRAVCEKLAGPDDVVIYLPLDFPRCVRRALGAVNAKALVLAESEFWPNLLRGVSKRGIPLVLVNGRVSDRSAPGYRKLRFFFGPVLRLFDALLVQSPLDRDRLLAAGASADRISVTGSVKFDLEPPPPEKLAVARASLAAAGIEPGRDVVLLGGSTWSGEESALAKAWREALRAGIASRLVLVPRHAERAPEVVAELEGQGFRVLRRSALSGSPQDAAQQANAHGATTSGEPPILLVDTTGELYALYALSDLVFVGKSLAPNVGGQNMIEPCALGRATIVGPHVENFVPVMERLRAAGALCEVADSTTLAAAVSRLLGDDAARSALGDKAAAAVESSRGALARTADAVQRALAGTRSHAISALAVLALAAALCLPAAAAPTVADARDFVSALGDELRDGGEPVRFACVAEPPIDDPTLPARLSEAGFNMVKLSGIPPAEAEDDPVAEAADAFVHACRTNGIRVWAEVLVPCLAAPPTPEDADVLDDPASRQAWADSVSAATDGGHATVLFAAAPWDPRLEVLLQKRLRQWARAFNAHTGLRRADDPAYAFFSLSSTWWDEVQSDTPPALPDFFSDELRNAWNNWLWARHSDTGSLARAIGQLADGENPVDGTVEFRRPGDGEVSPLRRAAQRRFMFSLVDGHLGRLASRFAENGPATASAPMLVRYGENWTLGRVSNAAIEKFSGGNSQGASSAAPTGNVPLVLDARNADTPESAFEAARQGLAHGAGILLLPMPDEISAFSEAAGLFRATD